MNDASQCPRQRSPKGRERREQVLAAAEACFRAEGFHGTSMSRIAAAAGMTQGHVFHYFKRKEDIVEAIVARQRSELDAFAGELLEAGAEGLVDAILARADKGVDAYLEGGRTALTMEILAEAARNPEVARIVAGDDGELRRVVGSMLGDDPAEASARWELLAALFEGLAVRSIRNPGLGATLDRAMFRRVLRSVLTG